MYTYLNFCSISVWWQLEVALEGISAATKISGNAASCLEILQGLTLDQLRWIFSSYDETQLGDNGWDAASLPSSDGNPATHLWSELNSLCAQEEIAIAFPDNEGTKLFFKELIFVGIDEDFAVDRNSSLADAATLEEMVDFITNNDNAITFFPLAYVIAEIDQELVNLVPITPVGEEESVKPSAASFEEGTYPLAHPVFMYLIDDEESLKSTRAFLEFGYFQGDEAVKSVGMWPIDGWKKVLMATRIQSKSGIALSEIQKHCVNGGDTGKEEVTIAGSSTVFPVARIFAEVYQVGCQGSSFTVEGGGSSVGARRVCGYPEEGFTDGGPPVDVGDMSREWKDSEVVSKDNHMYQCLEPGDPTRSVIQVAVALDGLTIAVKEGGTAYECIQILGGLTIDQLRWIYSSYNDAKLEETGWNPNSLKNSDRNSQTHLWSELDQRCPRIEIRIAGKNLIWQMVSFACFPPNKGPNILIFLSSNAQGAGEQSGTYEYFAETVFTDHKNGETFDLERPGFGYEASEVDEELVAYVNEFAEAISYFGYSYYYANMGSLSAVAIENDKGERVLPKPETVGDGSYNPLSRRIYMNLHNDKDSLEKTVPFVQFGLSHPALVEATGYVPMPDGDIAEITTVMNQALSGSVPTSGIDVRGKVLDRTHYMVLSVVMIGGWLSC